MAFGRRGGTEDGGAAAGIDAGGEEMARRHRRRVLPWRRRRKEDKPSSTEGATRGGGVDDDVCENGCADVAYLERFGFAAADGQTWLDIPLDEVPEGLERSGPWLGLGVGEHSESKGHTWYYVECSLAPPGVQAVEWQVRRRLRHLRESWHDPLKAILGSHEYRAVFGETPFAHRGGRKGTSVRLHEWCERLAARINSGQLSPAAVALTLRFLAAPDLDSAAAEGRVSLEDCARSVGQQDGSTRCGSEGSEDDIGSEAYASDFESDSEMSSEGSEDL
eukprot:TRINITY_DN27787_c0_g1_i1.p1 TRINITY_DN27787_c0_g1~~TRINITY_DN27787_c0_g1_i1.p1  ORF type:complete len:303 (-),score=72.93 TRINITY_DN27787_c0_g1_i1:83-913(-)